MRRNSLGFWTAMSLQGILYVSIIVWMLVADIQFLNWESLTRSLSDERVQYSIQLSLLSCTVSAIISVWIAIPTGYVLARLGHDNLNRHWAGKPFLRRLILLLRNLIDTILDIPIVLPPLVIGISLLVLFQTPMGRLVDQQVGKFCQGLGFDVQGVTYEIPAIVIAQTTVAAAFAIRTMRETFDQINERPEQVALTLGANRWQAFSIVALPKAKRGVIAALTLAWARSLGEFGPILIFAGTSRMKTEVLSTTVYLNFQLGNLEGAVSASMIMITLAMVVLLVTRTIGYESKF